MGLYGEEPEPARWGDDAGKVAEWLNATGLSPRRKVRLLQQWASDVGKFLSEEQLRLVASETEPEPSLIGWPGMARVGASTLERRTAMLRSVEAATLTL